MANSLILTLFFVSFFCSIESFSVVGYLPEWRCVSKLHFTFSFLRYLNWPSHEQWRWKELCETVTHLIIFSIEVKPTGDFDALDRFPPKETLTYAQEAAKSTGILKYEYWYIII
jgi:hypothetical protein